MTPFLQKLIELENRIDEFGESKAAAEKAGDLSFVKELEDNILKLRQKQLEGLQIIARRFGCEMVTKD